MVEIPKRYTSYIVVQSIEGARAQPTPLQDDEKDDEKEGKGL